MQAKPLSIKPLSWWVYFILFGLWVLLCLTVVGAVITLNLREAERNFSQNAADYVDHLNRDMVSSETILKGFSALFAAVGKTDPETVALYVKSAIEENDQIFALEIVQKVAKDRIAHFIASQKRAGFRNFTVRSYSYDTDRTWQAVEDKPFYYPIVFMAPLPPDFHEIIGLDVGSVPFLRKAMLESLERNAPVASIPFRLIEGNLGYVVFRPIPSQTDMIVDMVIDASKLEQPSQRLMTDGFRAVIYHNDFQSDDPKGQILSVSGKTRSALEAAIFPAILYLKSLETMGKPFTLSMTRQFGWSDLSLELIGLMGVLSLISSGVMLVHLKSIKQGRLEHIENQNHLWKLANHDVLTGIPNRMLLMDRLEQAMAVSERSGEYGALIFLDLDHFKALNDEKGHIAGDMLLVDVAKRIKECIRDVDTVARFGGDEFVVILSELGNAPAEAENAARLVAEKIGAALERPCELLDFYYRIAASVGVTMFLGNHQALHDLLKSADEAMYKAKAATKAHQNPRQHGFEEIRNRPQFSCRFSETPTNRQS